MRKILLPLVGIGLCFSASLVRADVSVGSLRGNFQQSCRDCDMRHNRLMCRCDDKQGNPHDTSMFNPGRCGFIENIDGTLQCTGGRRPHHRKIDVEAGAIWNQRDAERKCPRVCRRAGNMQWTGEWRTVRFGKNSVCGCRERRPWGGFEGEGWGGNNEGDNNEGGGWGNSQNGGNDQDNQNGEMNNENQ